MIACGHPVPDELIAPELGPYEAAMIDAWGDLSGDRHTDFGAVPFLSIDRWASRFGVDDPDDFLALVRAIRAADTAFLTWKSDEVKNSAPPPSPAPVRRNG